MSSDIQLGADAEARFRALLRRDETTGCLIFTGAKHRKGHGQFHTGVRVERAHRIAWVLAGNKFTDDKPQILHNCPHGDNPACCEVSHLYAGTHADNMLDSMRKEQGTANTGALPFGATKQKKGKTYAARLKHRGYNLYLGNYNTAQEASDVSKAARAAKIAGQSLAPFIKSQHQLRMLRLSQPTNKSAPSQA